MFEQAFKNIDDVLRREAGCTTELDYTEQSSWILFLKYLDDLEKKKELDAQLKGEPYTPIIDAKHRWSAWAAPKKPDKSFDHDNALTGDDLIAYVNDDLFPYLRGFKQRASGPDTIEYKIGEVFSEIKAKFNSGYNLRDVLEHTDELSFGSQAEQHELSQLYEAKVKRMGNAGRNGGEYYTPRPLIRAMVKVVKPKIGERIYDGAGIRGEPTTADYVLIYRGKKLGVIEAKKRDAALTEGLGQAKAYAAKLQTRFAFSTNGRGFYQVDMQTGEEGEIAAFPTPDALWAATFAEENAWRDRFAAVPLSDHGGKSAHYYQDIAIERVLEAIAAGDRRILLTLATGTGKTFIAFQLAWKLFYARWNLTGEPTRRPRILFLADRNILADQAYNAFSAFAEDARVRFRPEDVPRTGRVPKNANIFFTIFQTFMSGASPSPLVGEGLGEGGRADTQAPERLQAPHPPAPAPQGGGGAARANFYDYPPDFFDFIVIDECHRGGANDESTWRDIMEYFAPAVQLGLTATPRRDGNADTYRYFGEPVFVYSLKEGINDGFLTPFKVRQFQTTLDTYTYTDDDVVLQGEVEAGDTFHEQDFNRRIQIMDREEKRVRLFMSEIDQRQKTLVFCASQYHALIVRDLVNRIADSTDPNYCARVTADEGAIGDQHLRTFQDNERTIPTILTTSLKLSTGVDARNIRNIVLMRPIKSMIEFKQIIGRGTRLYDGKDYFTIYDFVGAHALFHDEEWDGEPVEPEPKRPKGVSEPRGPSFDPSEPPPPAQRIEIRLADGKARRIQHMASTLFYSPDGTPIPAAAFIERLFGELPALFTDEAELRRLWGDPATRKRLMSELAERGYGPDQLADIRRLIDAEHSDLFDVLAYIAFARPPITREERVQQHKPEIMSAYDARLRTFLDFVLDQYVNVGVEELETDKLPSLLRLRYHDVSDAASKLGGVPAIRDAFIGFQRRLYD